MSACIPPDPKRRKYGFATPFINSIKQYVGESPSMNTVRQLARNLGVDDSKAAGIKRAKKTGQLQHIFGKNLDDIKPWNPKAMKSGVPKDVLVEHLDENGVRTIFVSNRKTTTPPSRWIVQDGKITPNYDWSALGKNQTVDATGRLVPHTRMSGGYYRPAKDGDEKVFINIQKAYDARGQRAPKKLELAEQGYDAVLTNKGYRLIHEGHQAISPNRMGVEVEYGTVSKKIDTAKTVEGPDIADTLESLGLGKRTGMVLAGALAGEMVDGEDGNGEFYGGALGFLLGSKRVRRQFIHHFPQTKKGGDELDSLQKSLADQEKHYNDAKELVEDGHYRGDVNDTEEVAKFKDKFKNSYDKAYRAGESIRKLIFDNDYLESGVTFLSKLGSKTADKLLSTLRGAESYPHVLYERYSKRVQDAFGEDMDIRGFQALQADIMRRFIKQDPVLASKMDVENMSEKALREDFGAAVHRIITHEGKMVGDVYEYADDVAAQNVYAKNSNVAIDSYILRTEEGQKVVQLIKDTFEDYQNLATNTYRNEIDKLRLTFDDTALEAFAKFQSSGLLWKQFLDSESDKLLKDQLEKMMSGVELPEFREAVNYQERVVKLDKLRGKYVPQIFHMHKADMMRRRFLRENGLTNATDAVKQQEWEKHLNTRILEMNRDGFELLESMAHGDDVYTVYNKSFEKLVSKLRNELQNKIRDTEVLAEVRNDILRDSDNILNEYIGSRVINGRQMYFIKNPQKFQDRGINILADMNADEIGRANNLFLNRATLKTSNFLDNPRNYILPTEVIETDIEQIMRKYTNDAGMRLHLIANDLGSERRLQQSIKKIREEIAGKVTGDSDVDTYINRVKTWYAAVTHTAQTMEIGQTLSERAAMRRKKARTKKMVDIVRNLSYMPYLAMTTLYSAFTPLVSGPFLARWGNIANTYAYYFKNPESLKKATRELEMMGVIQRRLQVYAPEMDEYGNEMLLSSPGDIIDTMHHYTLKGVNFAANFSPTKYILGKMNVDLENTGLLRLFAGDVFDISGTESGLITMAVFRQVEEFVQAGLQLKNNPELGSVKIGGREYRIGDVRRSLQELGITDVDDFIKQSGEYGSRNNRNHLEAYLSRFAGDKSDLDSIPIHLKDQYNQLASQIVSQYHGTTKLSRPVKWFNNPFGHALSQFSVYSQNYFVQNVRRRTVQPMIDWSEKYASARLDKTPMFKVMWYMKNGDDAKLQKIFGDNWREAYNEFPVQAFTNFYKVMPAVIGVGQIMLMNRAAIIDTVNMLTDEALGNDDYEAWSKLQKQTDWLNVVGDDETGFDAAKLALGGLQRATEMSFGGRVAQLFINEAKFNQGGVWSKTPPTGLINDSFNAMTTFTRVTDQPTARTAKAVTDLLLSRAPVLGTFNSLTENATSDILLRKPENRDLSAKFYDADTGLELKDISIKEFD